jgi:catecholate siderophore receptor
LIYKPQENVSIYASYSIAYLPRSGEQLASLTLSNAALEPEEFQNLELGAKWDIRPELSAMVAIYQLNRGNVAIVNPEDPTELILADGDSQRARGIELGLAGKLTDNWSLMGGYAWQDGEITQAIRTSPTAVIPKGTVLAQVPEHTFSLWNRYDFNPQWGVGLGVVSRSAMFASTSNAVTLPGFTRFDGALFFELNERVQLQLNVENLLDKNYYASAHNDNNISPGAPRAFNLGLNLSF